MIRYQTNTDGVIPSKLQGFFVGWPNPPSPETHLRILQAADHVVVAIDEESGRVVGFINAISDGILTAYIPLLEVLPEYQGKGIGKELVRRILEELEGLYMIDLVCMPDLHPFYEPLGLQPAFAMVQRNFDVQSGRR
jgi:GNAT superfamily N-acetyltransferase